MHHVHIARLLPILLGTLLSTSVAFAVEFSHFAADTGAPEPVGLDPNPKPPQGEPADPSKDYFTRLTEFFTRGTQPTKAEIRGWWSGRCFTHRNGNTAIAGILLSADLTASGGPQLTSSGEGGPLFPPGTPTAAGGGFKLAAFMKESGPETSFDTLSGKDERTVLDVLYDSWPKLSETRAGDAFLFTHNEARQGFTYDWRLRKYQQYFILETVVVNGEELSLNASFFLALKGQKFIRVCG